uniref:Uncharacterized protein n=1 Tax=viral metagenome TaxID=1070528 RepID=A0A6C0C7R0_9ZZZZ
MVLSGVNIVLGYKISEEDLRSEFEDEFKEYIVVLKDAEDKKKRKKKADRYVYKFCKYEFEKYLNFLMYGTYDRKNPRICHSLPCCEYDDNNDWIIGLQVCHFDAFDLDPYDLSNLFNGKEKKRAVRQIFKKLNLDAVCDDDVEPEFYSIGNDCRHCT